MKKRRSHTVTRSAKDGTAKSSRPRSAGAASRRPGDPQTDRAATAAVLATVETWLNSGFGASYRRELVGDLTDLLFTLRQTESQLESMLASAPANREAAELQLFHLRIAITDDLPPIFRDIKQSIDTLIGPFD